MKTKAAFKSHLVLMLFTTIFTVLFSFTLSNMMNPYIVSDLGGSTDICSYTLSFFGVGNALGIPLGAKLPARFGHRKFFVGCMLLFALASWGCSSAATFPILVFFRFLEGFVSGPLYALIPIVLRMLPNEDRTNFTASTISIFTVVPVLGACWGGWLAYNCHWQWGFAIETYLMLILSFYMWKQLGQYDFALEREPFNGVGYFFYFIGLLSLSTVIILVQYSDWYRSPLLAALTLIGLPCFLFFLLWDWHHPYPILKMRLLKKFSYSFGLLCLSLLFAVYFATLILLAVWLNLYVVYTPIWIAYLFGIMGIIGLIPIFLVRKKYGLADYDTRITLGIAILFFAISSFHTMIFNEEIDFGRIVVTRITAGLGLAFFLPPLFRIAFHTFPEEESLHSMVLFQTVRALSSGLGVSIFTTTWWRRRIFFHERLGGALTPFNEITDEFFVRAKRFGLQNMEPLAQLDAYLDRNSTALALEDIFYLMAWMMVGLLFLLILTYLFRVRGFIPEHQSIPK